jgi:serine/threonine protein kinase
VYRAFDAVRNGEVALKLFHRDALDAQLAEAARNFEVSDGNAVLPLLEVHPEYAEGEVTVMRLMAGTLADVDHVFASQAVEDVRRILTALQFCHGRGVIHGDVKPSNAFRKSSGAVLLGDFGVRDFLPDGRRGHTLEYAAPELLAGGPRSQASDTWAAGVTLYELLCGQVPFGDRTSLNEETIIERISGCVYPHPDEIRPFLPLRFRSFFRRCFVADPDARAFNSPARMRGGLGDLAVHAEWISYRKEGYEIFFEGHKLSADGHRTGTLYEATIRHRPVKRDYEAVIARRPSGGKRRRVTGIAPFHGSKRQAGLRLRIWMRTLTDLGRIEA